MKTLKKSLSFLVLLATLQLSFALTPIPKVPINDRYLQEAKEKLTTALTKKSDVTSNLHQISYAQNNIRTGKFFPDPVASEFRSLIAHLSVIVTDIDTCLKVSNPKPLREIWNQLRSLRMRFVHLISKFNLQSRLAHGTDEEWSQVQRAKETIVRTLYDMLDTINVVIFMERLAGCPVVQHSVISNCNLP